MGTRKGMKEVEAEELKKWFETLRDDKTKKARTQKWKTGKLVLTEYPDTCICWNCCSTDIRTTKTCDCRGSCGCRLPSNCMRLPIDAKHVGNEDQVGKNIEVEIYRNRFQDYVWVRAKIVEIIKQLGNTVTAVIVRYDDEHPLIKYLGSPFETAEFTVDKTRVGKKTEELEDTRVGHSGECSKKCGRRNRYNKKGKCSECNAQ